MTSTPHLIALGRDFPTASDWRLERAGPGSEKNKHFYLVNIEAAVPAIPIFWVLSVRYILPSQFCSGGSGVRVHPQTLFKVQNVSFFQTPPIILFDLGDAVATRESINKMYKKVF
jgi:hypothetical protein